MRGKMIWFNEKKDHGFIRTDEDERLQVLGSGFAGGERPVGRCAEAVVTFDITERSGIRHAQNVRFEPDATARRARLRSGGLRVRS
jgi:cold shock CspA family protein